ncbi:GTP 3',8-cyclase MoaA [Azospirillum thermophilum]|uniref:GTP 3',8-cyclase n=1 Tax=Azospirillum thermophilum TaxID=2202148 RepID=A0A2S2CMC4_9PROT|nr:GTP 3',8-cyclase MoaA [Azospirillum thermophilum]AWK85663.1 GTP 3',8-cyclase MoaA [Azospirillum thermophilum]
MTDESPSDTGAAPETPPRKGLVDRHGRTIDYLRVSVTDRCNYRCVYCMGSDTTFLPREEVLRLDEIDRLCSIFIGRGVRKLRLTGGEPLVRRNILVLIQSLSRHLRSGALEELTLTTNGSQLARLAPALRAAGVRRINLSLDTLDPDSFAGLTRRGRLADVLDGIDAALALGFALKLNMVVMRGVNDGEIEPLMLFAHERGMDLTLIEVMPLGGADGGRSAQFLPLTEARARLAERYTLIDVADRTCGPARYVRVTETGGRVGFVTPMTHSFCGTCNRLRLTCTGQLALCLGREGMVDLRTPLRLSDDDEAIHRAIDGAMLRKPKGHDFAAVPPGRPALARPMSMTGG